MIPEITNDTTAEGLSLLMYQLFEAFIQQLQTSNQFTELANFFAQPFVEENSEHSKVVIVYKSFCAGVLACMSSIIPNATQEDIQKFVEERLIEIAKKKGMIE